ncbi:hypothetical protein OC842_007317 [Tilletia horrida]|uniref:Uncharacterized protein n=1 Tax=Tilletia horrida TaxID=155126 RepID=A0AAN6G4N0_9BASI|nr:hypothetical protein OC842_007317 [Tilletia horrida]
MGGKGTKKKDEGDAPSAGDELALATTSTSTARDDSPESVRAMLERVLQGQQKADDRLDAMLTRLDTSDARTASRLDALEGRTDRALLAPARSDESAAMVPSTSVDSTATAPANLGGASVDTAAAGADDSDNDLHRYKTYPSFSYGERNDLDAIFNRHGISFGDVFPSPASRSATAAKVATKTPPTAASLPITAGATVVAQPRADGAYIASGAPRQLICKAETLSTFDGDPAKLESFVSRVEDIARVSEDPAWDAAVRLAIPQALTGMASKWHSSLTKDEVRKLRRVSDVTAAMRRAFPMNRAEIRKLARERRWEAPKESAMEYYFDKVQLLRQAFGDTYQESSLAQDVADGLEPSMRAYIRLPSVQPTLQQLQDAIAEWEPTWRQVHHVARETPSAPPTPNQPDAVAPSAGTPPVRPPRSESRPAVDRSKSAPAQTSASVATLSQSYDPTRIVPAANGQPRMYRRPDSTRIMRLNRNCHKCGQPHFDFEHEHLLTVGKIHMLGAVGHDYDEVDESELDSPSVDVITTAAATGASF